MLSTATSTIEKTLNPKNLNNCFPRINSFTHFNNGVNLSRKLIGDALKQRVETIDYNVCEAGDEDTFFVADLGEIYRQHMRWKINLPRVLPCFAVKCNPDSEVIRLLAKLGAGFDCASLAEIDQVLKYCVDPTRIIYAQPCKTSSFLRYAASKNVRQMTFDNTDELYKIKKHFPEADLLLRISTDDSTSRCPLSLKFGASMENTEDLLDLAQVLGLNVIGVSFHIGSASPDLLAFKKAVGNARIVFDQAANRGIIMRTLDVGGGLTSEFFEPMAARLNEALDEYMPSHVHVIGEPGRYYVNSAFTLASHIIARRPIEDAETKTKRYMLYLNDGIYGNFSNIIFEHIVPEARLLRIGKTTYFDEEDSKQTDKGIEYSLWGPTCDSVDRIAESIRFDQELSIGDWLYFENMGAYTSSCASRFNGFTNNHEVIYVVSEPGAKSLLGMD